MHAGLDSARGARPRPMAQPRVARASLALSAVALLWFVPARGWAMTAEGALITNLASGTYSSPVSGAQTVISYGVTATVLVVNPTVLLQKTANPTLQSVAGTVTFCITFSNASAYVSAFNILILDVTPQNMHYVPGAGNAVWVNDPSAITNDYSPNGGQPPIGWVTGYPGVALGSTATFRWNVPVLGPGRSGYVCYMASVM